MDWIAQLWDRLPQSVVRCMPRKNFERNLYLFGCSAPGFVNINEVSVLSLFLLNYMNAISMEMLTLPKLCLSKRGEPRIPPNLGSQENSPATQRSGGSFDCFSHLYPMQAGRNWAEIIEAKKRGILKNFKPRRKRAATAVRSWSWRLLTQFGEAGEKTWGSEGKISTDRRQEVQLTSTQ